MIVDIANTYITSGKFERAAFLVGALSSSPEKNMLLGEIAAERGNWLTAREYWRQSGTVESSARLARAALEDGDYHLAQEALDKVPNQARSAEFNYLQSLIYLLQNNIKNADAYLAKIPGRIDNSWQLIAPYLRSVMARRQNEEAAAMKFSRQFLSQLDALRQQLERETGEKTMEGLLKAVSHLGPRFLQEKERRSLQEELRNRLIDPLPLYYRGVSLLWLGRTTEAIETLRSYRAHLPEADPFSYARALLHSNGE